MTHAPAPSPASEKPGRPPLVVLHQEVERLAGLGLTVAQISDRIGVSRRTLFARLQVDEELRSSMERGVSAAVEDAATILREEMLKGNLQAVLFFLKTKGGFNLPKDSPDGAVPPYANQGPRPAPITLDHVDGMAARQRALLGSGAR